MRATLIASSLLLIACTAQDRGRTFEMTYSLEDSSASGAFLIRYRNEGKKTVCVSPANWPNAAGKIDQAATVVWAEIDGTRYPLKDFNTGYCPGCVTRIRPGETIAARLPYQEFALPADLAARPKTLHFKPVGWFCKP